MILDDLASYLDTNSTLLASGTNLFTALMPNTPATMSGIFEYGGFPPVWAFGATSPTYERVQIQVLTRSTSYQTARTHAETIYGLLDNVTNSTTVSTTGPRYLQIRAVQSPFFIGRDENNRPQISCNYTVWKEKS